MRNQLRPIFKLSLVRIVVAATLILAALPGRVAAQQNNAAASSAVPQIIQFSGTLGSSASPIPSGTISITFTLYENEQGGTALWSETDNVQVDAQGHYTALLGSASPQGLPLSLFTTAQAHWLAVQPLLQGFAEQPRVLLVSAPYALKAGDAETIGGLPPSAFLRAATGTSSISGSSSSGSLGGSTGQPLPPTLSGSGMKNYIPIWTAATKLGDSILYQTAGGKVGVGTNTPAATLEVNGTAKFDNLITFASGQTFPGTGDGTITGVTAGTGLSGGGNSGSVTLSIASNACASGNALTALPFTCSPFATLGANTFSGNQGVTGNVTASGTVTGAVVNATSSFDLGGAAFALGSTSTQNAFVGFAGNTMTTGAENVASGYAALSNNTTGYLNMASGVLALYSNTTGNSNTASGGFALSANTTGGGNTAAGAGALQDNSTGGDNTAAGYQALYSNTTASYNTAAGYQALYSNTTAGFNTATGSDALYYDTTGNENTAAGSEALYYNTTGTNNTAAGLDALYDNTSGSANTAVGDEALSGNTTGNDLTCIGFKCTADEDDLRNATAIGAHAVVGESNALVLGGTGQYAVKVGIGTATPSNVLTIAQGAGHPVSDGWETFSSRRWKTNIQTLQGALAEVEQLRGVSYDLKATGKHEVGVIAEEVGAVVPEVVTWEKNGKDAQSVDYSRLTALLIEATKEQQTLIHQQQDQLKAQEVQIKAQQRHENEEEAQIAELASEMKTVQASLRTRRGNGHARLASAKGTPAPAATEASLPVASVAQGGN
jgi:hypothetical protein